MRALVIKKEPLDRILSGKKTWEIRRNRTTRRGWVALVQSGSGTIVGYCQIADVIGPLKKAELVANARKLGKSKSDVREMGMRPRTYAWVLRYARRLRTPIAYEHPNGAIIWVNLEGTPAARKLGRLLPTRERRTRKVAG